MFEFMKSGHQIYPPNNGGETPRDRGYLATAGKTPHLKSVPTPVIAESAQTTADTPLGLPADGPVADGPASDNSTSGKTSRKRRGGARGPASVRLFSHYVRLPILILAAVEIAVLIGAVYLGAQWWYNGNEAVIQREIGSILPKAAVFAGMIMTCIIALGLYSSRSQPSGAGVILRLAVAFSLAGPALVLVYYLIQPLDLGRGVFVSSGLIAFAGLAISRFVFLRSFGDVMFQRRILSFGAGEKAASLTHVRLRADLRGFDVVGFVWSEGDNRSVDVDRLIDVPGSLLDFARENDIDEIVVAPDDRRRGLPVEALLECRLAGISIVDLLTFLERESGKVQLSLLYPSWLIFSDGIGHGPIRNALERIFDLVSSTLLLMLTWPIMLVTALAVWAESGFRGPILYRQTRVGLEGAPFELLKFRSMKVDAEANGEAVWASTNDPRVTRIGEFLRKYRIDELPQLINVLRGEMSFVGPRPERPEFVDGLAETLPYYRERHCVKPGITG
ncbi:MAG: TIGR03013 family XrtA/PEP-CTERM system glycosyltransferase, partial [Gammaproteobacteria bacterium]